MKILKQLVVAAIWSAVIVVLIMLVDFKKLEFKQFGNSSSQISSGTIVKNAEPSTDKTEFSGTADDVIALVNQARQQDGKDPLKKNDLLMKSAMLKAEDMKEKGYFDHESLEGLKYWFFVDKVGYKYSVVGENIAEGYFSSQELHEAWMNSEGHRKNILSDSYTEIGVAILPFQQNGQTSYLAVQHFASPPKVDTSSTKTVCELQSKQHCETAQTQLAQIKALIKEQEKIIQEAKDQQVDQTDLKNAKTNLEKLNNTRQELEKYLDSCRSFIKNCDVWK